MTGRLTTILAATLIGTAPATVAQPPAANSSADPAPIVADRDTLLRNVTTIAAPGTPGAVCIWGPNALPLVAGKGDRNLLEPVAAAAHHGAGRLIAFSHTGYLDAGFMSAADTGRLIHNAVRWAAGPNVPVPRVRMLRTNLGEYLESIGFEAAPVAQRDLESALLAADEQAPHVVLITGPGLSESQVDALEAFVATGGGVIAAQTAWAWRPPDGQTLEHNPLNRLFARSGIAWTAGTTAKTSPDGFAVLPADAPDFHLLHAATALSHVEGIAAPADRRDSRTAQASHTATIAARSLPVGDTILRPTLWRLLESHRDELVPTAHKPMTDDQPLLRTLLAAQIAELESIPAAKVIAHPAATFFPGGVPVDAPRVDRTITLPRVPGWRSTGLYAAPGEAVTITMAAPADDPAVSIRIGCHTDRLWHHGAWKRVPEISGRWPLRADSTTVASAFGGLIYLEPAVRGESADPVTLTISGAVEAPLYVLGETSAEAWSTIRERPAPWAELASRKIVLSVPSAAIRTLDDPHALMTLWDRIADCQDELATVANLDRHGRPDRFVADVQISAGYMHSGYPIMTHLDAVDDMTDPSRLLRGSWGLFHELGHNHQNGDWTFDGTVEVTVNLFSLYTMERICGKPVGEGHPALARRDERIGPYLAQGAKFEQWKSDPFLALIMYQQLAEAFGWETYQRVFVEYLALDESERPRTDDDKRDQWLVRFSRACGRNLGPFFETWGVPTSEAARNAITDLPAWMPAGFPPE